MTSISPMTLEVTKNVNIGLWSVNLIKTATGSRVGVILPDSSGGFADKH